MDDNLLWRLFEMAVGLAVMAGGFIMKGIRSDINTLWREHSDDSQSLSEHKIHVAENYASKAEVSQQFSILVADLKEVKSDIKQLLKEGR